MSRLSKRIRSVHKNFGEDIRLRVFSHSRRKRQSIHPQARVPDKPFLSIVCPAYNEAESLPLLTEKLAETIRRWAINAEIVLVDDGSTDNTLSVMDKLSERFKELRVFRHEDNLGKTRAMYTGFMNSQGEYVMLFESDLQYDPYDIPKFIPLMELDYDIVNGYRKFRMDPFYRTLLSKFYNLFLRLLFGVLILDHNSGFKVLKKNIALKIFHPRFIENMGIDPKNYHRVCLVVANKLGYTIDEVAIRHYRRRHGKSYINFLTPFSTLKTIIKLRILLWNKNDYSGCFESREFC